MEPGRQPNQSDEKRYWCKIFQTKHDFVGAICDLDLLGKTLSEGDLKVKVSEHFYGGVQIGDRAALKIMGRVTIGNLFGREIVALALKGGFITEENLIFIDGVPHAQFIKV